MSPDRRRQSIAAYLGGLIGRWRSGSTEGQLGFMAALLLVCMGLLVLSLTQYDLVPIAVFVLPLIVGGLVLRWRPFMVIAIVSVGAAAVSAIKRTVETETSTARAVTFLVVLAAAVFITYMASRARSGLPGALGESMLEDLRARLNAQGTVPTLPPPWRAQSSTKSSEGTKFAGDFMVANLSDNGKNLEMILVDVCGKGVAAGTQSLQLAGALGGLIGSLPPQGLMAAANDFLLRQTWDEGFATAVHVTIDLTSGRYVLTNAGHPPALIWQLEKQAWQVDDSRGLALGVARYPEFIESEGVLDPGEALMFYTDGVIERRDRTIDEGLRWLQEESARQFKAGFDGLADRILSHVSQGDDDRAVLILGRLS